MSDEPTLAEVHRVVLRVEKLAEKTNGRVTALEMWKARAGGVLFALSLASPVVSALVVNQLAPR